jgi:hypothetical protein
MLEQERSPVSRTNKQKLSIHRLRLYSRVSDLGRHQWFADGPDFGGGLERGVRLVSADPSANRPKCEGSGGHVVSVLAVI